MPPLLVISAKDIRRHGPGNVLRVCWRQWRGERRLARRGIHFRATDLQQVEAAYAAMSEEDFDAINARQDWANWRTIPRALSGHVLDQPLRVLDLGCGAGNSTRVLACYCPAGSHITGYEIAEPLLRFARNRNYHTRARMASSATLQGGAGGEAPQTHVNVDFVCQGVTETLRDTKGDPIATGSVDVVNASGVVGHHLNRVTIGPLIEELGRVLSADGIAMLDVGPTLPAAELRDAMATAGFAWVRHYRSWWGDPTGECVFRRQAAEQSKTKERDHPG